MNAAQVVAALRAHYGQGWNLIEQVGDTTGAYTSRHLDVVAVGLWPSRGLEIHGIEVKVSKADLRRELEQPDKAEPVAKYCDRFFVAAPAGVADATMLEALVPGWGLLDVTKRADRTVVAVKLPAAKRKPEPMNRQFVAALLRKIPEPTAAMRAEITQEVIEEYEKFYDQKVEHEVKRRLSDQTRMIEQVRAFERASGIELANGESWRWVDGANLGEAVALLARYRKNKWDSLDSRLRGSARLLTAEAKRFETLADEIEKLADGLGLDNP